MSLRVSIVALVVCISVGCGDDGGSMSEAAGSTGSTDGSDSAFETGTSTEDAGTTGSAMEDTGRTEDATTTGLDATTEASTTTEATTSTSTGEGVCGDGVLDPGEVCDVGTNDGSYGCSDDCSTATCLVPVSHPSIQAAVDDAACPTIWVMPDTYPENVSVARDLVIEGVPLGEVIVDGNSEGRVFSVQGGAITLRRLTVTHGSASSGAGISTDAPLVLDDTRVVANVATGSSPHGGGIATFGDTLTITHGSEVSNNVVSVSGVQNALGRGGGISAQGTTIVLDEGSSVSGNLVEVEGAGGLSHVASGGGLWLADASFSATDATVGDNSVSCSGASSLGHAARGAGFHALSSQVVLGPGTVLAGNHAHAKGADSVASGGGAWLDGSSLAAERTLVSDNVAEVSTEDADSAGVARAGAIRASAHGSDELFVTLVDTTVVDNMATANVGVDGMGVAEGGAIYLIAYSAAELHLELTRTTVAGNQGSGSFVEGGAIRASAVNEQAAVLVSAVSATLSGNVADGSDGSRGGAIYARTIGGTGSVTVRFASSTIVDNASTATQGGGVSAHRGAETTEVSVEIRNSILYGNTAPSGPDCWTQNASVASLGWNLVGTTASCQITGATDDDLVGTDPLLGPLGDNGGFTPTHALAPPSPAVDAANPEGCTDLAGVALSGDQRGEPRPSGPACDMGAYEYQQ